MQINRKISAYNYSSGNNVKYIVIHSTGNTNDTAKNNADYFNGGDRNASAHYFVDDNSIWQVVEEYNQSWHCDDGNGMYGIANYNSIGIEMCGTANGYISEQTINNTIELTKQLMKKYGVSSNNVVRHFDASRKNCPSQFAPNNWARWNNFKNRLIGNVITIMEKNEGIVTANVLNVRNKPNGNIIGTLSNGAVIRIDKKVDNWYSIFYGEHGGYVSADYIKTEFEKENINNKEVYDMKKIVLYFGDMDANAAIYVAQKNKCPMMKKSDFDISGLKVEKIIQIGGKAGSTRYDSLKDAGKLV